MSGEKAAAGWPEPAQSGARDSVLASDLLVEGDVVSKGPVQVHGKIMGRVHAPDVVVASPGIIEGSVVALELTVQGAVSGDIAAKRVSFAASAVVLADVTHEQIAIESGARIEGRLKRGS